MPVSLGGDGTDGGVNGHPQHKSGYNGSFVLRRNRINMKAIALESKSNQAGSHSDENELIRKATCLLKGREIKTEEGGYQATAAACFQMSLQLCCIQLQKIIK